MADPYDVNAKRKEATKEGPSMDYSNVAFPKPKSKKKRKKGK